MNLNKYKSFVIKKINYNQKIDSNQKKSILINRKQVFSCSVNLFHLPSHSIFYYLIIEMNLSTPTSLQNKTKFLKQRLQQIHSLVASKQPDDQKSNQMLRIQFISFLDQMIDKIEILQSPNSQTAFTTNPYKPSSNPDEYKERYFETQKQRIQLQKKITELLQKQIRQQQHALKLQRAQSQSLKQKAKLEATIKQQNAKIQKLTAEINHCSTKLKDQDKQLHRLITLNQKLNEEKDKLTQQRSRAEKRLHQLLQKYQGDQVIMQNKNTQGQKFNIHNTEGIRTIRILTNVSSEKKNQQKYFILQLPSKLEVLKLVYGIKIGMINSNKQVVYFNEIYTYEKDPIKMYAQNDYLVVEYQKRKEKIVIDKFKLLKPQVVVLLYGRGDSVMLDETK